MISIKIDDREMRRYLKKLDSYTGSEAVASAAEIILNRNQDRNQREVDPDGKAWKPLSDLTKKTIGRSDRILYGQGDLLRLVIEKNGNSARVGTRSEFAEYHQFGTEPYKICPKRAQALTFAGLFARGVNHPGLPARQILGINSDDEERIIRTIQSMITPA